MPVEIPLEKWTGKIHQVKLGGNGRKSVIVGGQTTLPFLHFDGAIPNRPVVAVEIFDCEPSDWSPTLTSAWGNVIKDPALWAKKAVEYGAELIQLTLRSAHPDDGNTGVAQARISTEKILSAIDVPVIITGPGVAEKDNEILIVCSEVARGQRIA
ncbi:MAG: acetyl-CoA decarbonylase/synthase complex subunit delta, partial [Chloroflexi bacterium]|nr:acetyl-CoA decarbonylase/synthase complex subunit delta [Chloroflexota bacterium]